MIKRGKDPYLTHFRGQPENQEHLATFVELEPNNENAQSSAPFRDK
jgi:hypothetical protein